MRLLGLLAATLPAFAHSVSISTGELVVDGAAAVYRVRLPDYELQHVREPQRTVLDAVQLRGAALVERRCDHTGSEYVCEGRYVWPSEPANIYAAVRLADVVVGHHVHLLHARRGDGVTQAVFTSAEPAAELTFRQAGPVERVLRARPVAAMSFLLIALTLATQRRSAIALFAAAAVLGVVLPWRIAPAFGEAAIAILAAYSAFEALTMESARARWIAWALLGVGAGSYGRSLLVDPATGALLLASVCAAGLALAFVVPDRALRPLRLTLLVAGLVWVIAVLL